MDYQIYVFHKDDGLTSSERLKRAIGHYSGQDDFLPAMERSAAGKPFFPDHPSLCFSISHSGDFWACAVGGAPVGLDLQKYQPSNYTALSKRFFHPAEDAELERVQYSPAYFFDLWTRKESYIKFTGRGLSQELESFSTVDPLPDAVIQTLPFLPDYSLSLCAAKINHYSLYHMTIASPKEKTPCHKEDTP